MVDGDFRRAPRLWEQQMQTTMETATLGVVSAAASAVPGGVIPAPGGVGSDPAPPHYSDISSTPGTPTVANVIAGIAVTWSGQDSAANQYPEGTYAEVHVSTSSGFTPDSSTLKGTLSRAGTFTVTGLTAGTTYYVRLIIVDQQGQRSPASAQASTSAGFVTSGAIGTATITADLVAFDATAIGGIQQYVGTSTPPTTGAVGSTWVNTSDGSYNVLQTVSGAKTWVRQQWSSGGIAPSSISTLQLSAGAVTADIIAAQAITGKLVSGEVIRTSSTDTGARVRISSTDGVEVYDSTGRVFQASPAGTVTVKGAIQSGSTISGASISGGTISGATIATNGTSGSRIELTTGDTITFYSTGVARLNISTGYNTSLAQYVALFSGGIDIGSGGIYVSGAAVDLPGVYGNNTTGIDAVGIGSSPNYRLRRISSSQAIKYDITPLSGTLSPSVDPERTSTVATVDPSAILDVAVTEFSVIDDGQATDRRVLGFIADDVADKLPIAVTRYDDGSPAGVLDTSLLAALLAVVQSQQTQLEQLTARLEALEA